MGEREIKVVDDEQLRFAMLGEGQASTLDLRQLFFLADSMLSRADELVSSHVTIDENSMGAIELSHTSTEKLGNFEEEPAAVVEDAIEIYTHDQQDGPLLRINFVDSLVDRGPDSKNYFGSPLERKLALSILTKALDECEDPLKKNLYSKISLLCRYLLGLETLEPEADPNEQKKGELARLIGRAAVRRSEEILTTRTVSHVFDTENRELFLLACEIQPNPEYEELISFDFTNSGPVNFEPNQDELGLKEPKIQISVIDRPTGIISFALLLQNNRVISRQVPNDPDAPAVSGPMFFDTEEETPSLADSGHEKAAIEKLTSALVELSFIDTYE